MDLKSFTSEKKEKTQIIILDNDDIQIIDNGEEYEFFLKNKNALKKYSDILTFSPSNSTIINNEEEAVNFFNNAIEEKTEGLMFKNLNSIYKAGLRTGAMAKYKEHKDDLDLVIVGAEHGKGKRAGFYSSFIVAVQNPHFNDDDDKFLVVGKVSSGIKELGDDGASLENMKKLLEPIKIKEEKGVIYFEAKIILEVRYQEIQKSSIYNSGYALRFPRIIRLREDKTIDEIASIEDIRL